MKPHLYGYDKAGIEADGKMDKQALQMGPIDLVSHHHHHHGEGHMSHTTTSTTYFVTLPSSSYKSGAHKAYFRHNMSMNILFMDGHAESRSNLGIPSTTSRKWRGDLPRNQITCE